MSTSPIFSGTYPCLVDDKGRLTIPKSMRAQVPNSQEKYWVTVMIPERCVAVYTNDGWDDYYKRLQQESGSYASPENRERFRIILEKTYIVKPDTQGRFRLHPALARIARFDARILAIGSGDHVEYWALERRQEYARSMGIVDEGSYADFDVARDEGETDEVADR